MHQSLQGATFHVEHVLPRSRNGQTLPENLAWACPRCNLLKSDRVQATDPGTGDEVPLFDPRAERWGDHFSWDGYYIMPRSAIGRATVAAFDLNQPRRIRIRQAEELFGLFPPDDA